MQQRGGFLADRQAGARDLRGQLRHREARAILYVDGVDVRVGAERESHGKIVATVRAARRLIVERVVDAVDLLLDRLRHRGLDHFGIGAGIICGERDLWRHDFRELRDRNRSNGDDAGKRDDDCDDDGEPRPFDEGAGEHFTLPARRSPSQPARGAPSGYPR